jgi:predicted ester cyclase
MSIERTKEIVDSYIKDHNADAVAEDGVYILMATGEEVNGRENIGYTLQYFYQQAFDATFEPNNIIYGDGHAFVEGNFVGKHIGEFVGIPATGKDVRVPMCISYDVGEEKIEKARVYFLMASLTRQLGIS